MNSQQDRRPHERVDGFGRRRLDIDPQHGPVEVLELASQFAGVSAEQTLRARAARITDLPSTLVATIHRVDRTDTAPAIVSAPVSGVLLVDLLAATADGAIAVTDATLFELAAAVIGAVGALHALPGGFAHGAIAPSHVAIAPGGRVMLTDAAISPLLRDGQHNREHLWRTYGLAFPASAGLPRFDQRTDVTQLGATVLAILLRRPLGGDEYPRNTPDLLLEATSRAMPYDTAIRMWLQQALQLHPRSMFGSGVDAAAALIETTRHVTRRRAAADALERLVRDLCGTSAPEPRAVERRGASHAVLGRLGTMLSPSRPT
jgi:hypothetical protein